MIYLLSLAMAQTPTERPSDTWDPAHLYPSLEAWQVDLELTRKLVDGLGACEGKVATQLKPCLDQRFDALKQLWRVYVYASIQRDGDTRSADWQSRARQVELLEATLQEKTAYYAPEIIAMGSAAVEAAIRAEPGLAPYDYYLRSTVKFAPHTLDADREALLAGAGGVLTGAGNTRDLFFAAELPWPTVTLSDGKPFTLSPAAYTSARALPVREDRKKVFDSFFGAMKAYEGTLGSTLDTSTQGHWYVARAHNYGSSLEAAVDRDHLPPAVYQTLIASTNQNLPTLHRYLELRARMLGISDLAYHDLYTPLVSLEKRWTIDEAEALTVEACRPLGPGYTETLKQGFSSRWMDVYPRPGKQAGAYMQGAAVDVHPYVLMNYNGDYESVSTLAHEWGHALHSVLSAKAQPFAKADYATFIAEIASTFNEALLLQQMLKTAKSDDERLYYLGTALESLRTTYFRQALFAEFELRIHEKVEKGEPLTGDEASRIYLELARRYYGHEQGVTRVDEAYAVEWAYVGHFYRPFYVWQYASSLAAASALAADVYTETPGAQGRVLALLEAGGSAPPVELLRAAGVDLESPAPYDAMARRMEAMMDHVERILARR